MGFNVPYAGDIQRRVLRFLYDNQDRFSTGEIAEYLSIERESIYSALAHLHDRQYVRKYKRGNECLWELRFDRVHEIRNYLHIRNKHFDELEQEYELKDKVLNTIAVPVVEFAAENVLKFGITYAIPFAREIYVGYQVASWVYNAWSTSYNFVKTAQDDGLGKATYNFVREQIADGLLRPYQTEALFGSIKDRIPTDYQEMAHRTIDTIMGSVTEEEINLVEQSLE